MKSNTKKMAGLTLIELIITLAILGIISALAIPAYDRYTRKSVRAAAKTELEKVRSLMETYYINNKTCTTDLTAMGYSISPAYIDKTGNEVAAASNDRVYQIEVASCTANTRTYSVTATPQMAQTNDTDCTSFTVNNLGQKTATGANSSKCW
jgi:type IV pilus assembly protein PilE